MDDADSATSFNPTTDITTQLMNRYSKSSAPQHRHLIATSSAMKSLLLQNSLPLTPLSYFAATMSSLSQPDDSDSSSAALSTLLSIVLPLIPAGSISPQKAADAVDVLMRVLADEAAVGSTSGARCVVKCLGLLLLGFCDLTDWEAVRLPFQTLLHWSIDKRPKVRRCALDYLEDALKRFQSGNATNKPSELILALMENYMPIVVKLGVLKDVHGSGSEAHHEAEHQDIVHVLSVVRVGLPYLSDSVSVKVVSRLAELLEPKFSAITRLILSTIETLLDRAEAEVISQFAEDIINALSLYILSKTNPEDTVIFAASLLEVALGKIRAGDADRWNKCLSPGVNAIAGLLTREGDTASKSSNILKNLIDHQLLDIESTTCEVVKDEPESIAITSICSVLTTLLDAFTGIPNEHALAVVSVMFLKLGRRSLLYMSNTVLKLGEIFIAADKNKYNTRHLEKCFGCAVVAMGIENVLSLVPISFDAESSTCSNMWLLPVLKKYVSGASLRYFIDHIVPLAKSLQRASRKVKKSVIGRDLQAHARALWGLLPAFCRHPTDVSESYQSFAKLLLIRMKKDASMYDDIADALQVLVRQFKCLPKCDTAAVESLEHSSNQKLEDFLLEKRSLLSYSKKDAKRNMKALSLHSNELAGFLMIVFLDSLPEKRSSLKKAISSLASMLNASFMKEIFISSLERFPLVKTVAECRESDLSNDALDEIHSVSNESQWSLTLDLASSVVEGADEDLIALIYKLTKVALKAGDGISVGDAYHTLSCILENHPWFCSSNMDELVDLMSGLKSPTDTASFSNRLSCFRAMLVCALKNNSNVENSKPFLILNNIILAQKDSKEEARKAAYDMLLEMGSRLRDSSSANPDEQYHRLISMILGYLSGPSPHITSAAVSALSVLVFKEPDLCVKVPDVVSSVTSLLHAKAVEVIKAVLGFIKVVVSCLEAKELQTFLSVMMDGLLPWSSVSRHHFRSKVTVVLEILIRKCGLSAVTLVTPERYQPFIRKVSQNRHGKTNSEEADSTPVEQQNSVVSAIGSKKRRNDATNNEENSSKWHQQKRSKHERSFNRPRSSSSSAVGLGKKVNHFGHKKAGGGHEFKNLKMKRGGNSQRAPTRPQQKHGAKPYRK